MRYRFFHVGLGCTEQLRLLGLECFAKGFAIFVAEHHRDEWYPHLREGRSDRHRPRGLRAFAPGGDAHQLINDGIEPVVYLGVSAGKAIRFRSTTFPSTTNSMNVVFIHRTLTLS